MKGITAKVCATAFLSMISSSQAFSSINVSGTNTLDINGVESYVNAYNSSTVNLLSNSNVSYLDTYDTSTANLYAGTLGWLSLHGHSSANLYASDLGWLVLDANATANIYGSDFNYSGGILSGKWSNGAHFSFWAVNNGGGYTALPSNITLNTVPLPPSILLFASSMLVFNFRRKS